MEDIAKPTKINFQDGEDKNQGIITIEPCYPGYGTTLGNALRRVLLSSLSGAAVIGVKIEGANHEFTTLPYVKEDILEIILNLKKLRVKMHTEEDIKLELNAHGEKEIKAKDITKDSQVEIVNPDLTLAHIIEMAGSLKMDIYVSQGKGYRPVESVKKEEKETDFIDMDAIFSPILSTGINVDNVRVGKMTNWDKLSLDVVTDGTITPKEAFQKAVRVLVEQFSFLLEEYKKEKTEEDQVKEEKEKTVSSKKEKATTTKTKKAGSAKKETKVTSKSGSTKNSSKSAKMTQNKKSKK